MRALTPLALLCARVAALQRAEIIAAPSAKELERVAPQLIRKGDCVLSAGVALESQAEMRKRLAGAGQVVSVDVPRKASRSRRELFRSDQDRHLTRAGDVTAVLRPDECFDCVVVDAAALLGFDLPLDTLALCEALRRRQPARGAPLEPGDGQRAEGHALEPHDGVAHGLGHAPQLAVAALR